jgi:hypothetical protein
MFTKQETDAQLTLVATLNEHFQHHGSVHKLIQTVITLPHLQPRICFQAKRWVVHYQTFDFKKSKAKKQTNFILPILFLQGYNC